MELKKNEAKADEEKTDDRKSQRYDDTTAEEDIQEKDHNNAKNNERSRQNHGRSNYRTHSFPQWTNIPQMSPVQQKHARRNQLEDTLARKRTQEIIKTSERNTSTSNSHDKPTIGRENIYICRL